MCQKLVYLRPAGVNGRGYSPSLQAIQQSGLPEEQPAAIAFLASDDASFITGQVVNRSGVSLKTGCPIRHLT